jgi:hypothetical protein
MDCRRRARYDNFGSVMFSASTEQKAEGAGAQLASVGQHRGRKKRRCDRRGDLQVRQRARGHELESRNYAAPQRGYGAGADSGRHLWRLRAMRRRDRQAAPRSCALDPILHLLPGSGRPRRGKRPREHRTSIAECCIATERRPWTRKSHWPVTFLSSPPNQAAAGVLRRERSCPAALPHQDTNDRREWFE